MWNRYHITVMKVGFTALKGFIGVGDIKIYAGEEQHNMELNFVR